MPVVSPRKPPGQRCSGPMYQLEAGSLPSPASVFGPVQSLLVSLGLILFGRDFLSQQCRPRRSVW